MLLYLLVLTNQLEALRKVVEESGESIPTTIPASVGRQVARSALGDTLLQLDEHGSFHEASTQELPAVEQDIILIDG